MNKNRNARKILLVDDQKDVLIALENRLLQFGYEVYIAQSAQDAIINLKNIDIDLIISDVNLEDSMSGTDVLEAAQLYRPGVPFIFLTANVNVQDIEKYKKAGAVDCFIKPFDGRDLTEKIQVILQESKGGDTFQPLEDREKKIILKALKETGGAPRKAAELIGISLRSIQYKIRKYAINADIIKTDI